MKRSCLDLVVDCLFTLRFIALSTERQYRHEGSVRFVYLVDRFEATGVTGKVSRFDVKALNYRPIQ